MRSYFREIFVGSFFILSQNANGGEALLIGVSNYPSSPLSNPVNDVQLISKTLTKKGWNSTTLINPTSEQLKEEVRNFYSQNKNRDVPTLLYFSGHGLQYRGENYLLPVDVSNHKSILSKSLSITEIGYFSKEVKSPKIFIIDACRNSPLGKDTLAISSGLNSQYAPPNSLIAYATSPGDVALDGDAGTNSPYAKSFSISVERYNSIDDIFKKTRSLTMASTGGKQLPWESSSLFQEVYLAVDIAKQSQAQSIDKTQYTAQSVQTTLQINSNNNIGTYTRPSISETNFENLLEALDRFKIVLERSSIAAFEKRNGESSDERDRQDFIASIEAYKVRYKTNPAGVAYGFITALQTGVFYPSCRKGNGVDSSCGDFDRYFKFTPSLKLSLELAKMAHSKKIRSDKLALHYMNGWGVDKDLLKAYDLFESDRSRGGSVSEYWWTNINSMVQTEMNKLGYKVGVDGDFGVASCKALKEIIGDTKCGRVVTKDQISAMLKKYKSTIE